MFPQTAAAGARTPDAWDASKPGRRQYPDDPNPLDPHRAEKQEKLRNNDRQKRLVADTDKLLALATDLKQQVDKTDKEILVGGCDQEGG